MAQVYIAYAHPIGEDADVFWTAAGTTQEKAMDRLVAKIADQWNDGEETIEETEKRIRAEMADGREWCVAWDEDALE